MQLVPGIRLQRIFEMFTFSVFESVRVTVPRKRVDLHEFAKGIKKGWWWRDNVEIAREYAERGDEESYREAKKRLPAITPYGVFKVRNRDSLAEASGLFVLDFDGKDHPDIASGDWERVKRDLCDLGRDHIACAFISPRGDGLKVFFRVDPEASLPGALEFVREHWCVPLGLKLDESGKDISRLCFVSYDPDCYLAANVDGLIPVPLPEEKLLDPAHAPKAASSSSPVPKSAAVARTGNQSAGEDDGEKFVRYLDTLADQGKMSYEAGVEVIGAAVAFWGADRAASELAARWPEGDKKLQFAKKCRQAIPCSDPLAMLGKAGGKMGVKLRSRNNAPRKATEKKAVTPPDKRGDQEKEITGCWDEVVNPLIESFFYDQAGKTYYYDTGEAYVAVNGGDAKMRLSILGLSKKRDAVLGYSVIDYALDRIRLEKYFHFAGDLAGKKRGWYEIGESKRVLVLNSPNIMEPVEGEWPTIRKVIYDLMGMNDKDNVHSLDQLRFFLGWIKIAYETLRSGVNRPGQVLILAGPPACGKTLLKLLICEILGGRMGSPYEYLRDNSRFNEDLAGTELLAVDDVQGSPDLRVRRAVSGKIKEMLFSGWYRIEPKGGKAFSFSPFWRMIMCVNDEPEDLLVLPPLSAGIEDKLAMVKCSTFVSETPIYTGEEKKVFFDKLRSEIPAFLFAITGDDIPESLKESRCGVKAFQNPELVAALGSIAPETLLLALIDEHIAYLPGTIVFPWVVTAQELRRELTDGDMPRNREAHVLLDKYPSICGSLLGKLANSSPERVKKGKLISGIQRWEISKDEEMTYECVQKALDFKPDISGDIPF